MVFQAYTLEYVFRIPDEVTLPEDRPSLDVDKKWPLKADKRRQELERDIIKVCCVQSKQYCNNLNAYHDLSLHCLKHTF